MGFVIFCVVLFGLVVAHLTIVPPFKFMKRFYCRMGWHSFPAGFESTGFDGCSVHARCKWCGYEGMIDSQGNLF
jgi:hypothetical protein